MSDDTRAALLSRFIAAGQVSNRRSRQTRIEEIVRGWLLERAQLFEQNRQIGRYNVDFLPAGSRAIECFGDFWHCNPDLYAAAWYNGSLHSTAAEKWAKDARRLDALRDLGIVTLVLWERQIRERPHEALAQLDDFLRQTRAAP